MNTSNRIIAIVGPKGGVGKSTISANLAIALAQMGQRVIAVDLDLGASNLHTIFGIRSFDRTLADFILNKESQINRLVMATQVAGLGIICGGDIPGIANLHHSKKLKLIRNLSQLEGDVVLLDLSAGAAHNVIDFLIFARLGLMITTPEVPSLINVYSFIKTLIFRRLSLHFRRLKADRMLVLLEHAKDTDANPELKTMDDIIGAARALNVKFPRIIHQILASCDPVIIINRVTSQKDAQCGQVIQNLMRQYLNINSSIVMTVHEDKGVGLAIAKLKPVLLEAPGSVFARDIKQIAQQLLQMRAYPG